MLAFLTLPHLALCQEQNDSLLLQQGAGLSAKDIEELTAPITPTLGQTSASKPEIPMDPVFADETPALKWRSITPPRGGYFPTWSTGYLYGSHSSSGSLLYGYTSYANIGIKQHLGDYWTFDGNIGLQKYSVYYNTAVFYGSINWHPTHWFELTAFGSYMPGSFLSPVQISPAFQWGGFATLQTDTDVPFGIDLGARDSYDPMSGHQVTPIVQPFVKVGGAKIGIDFGPMIRDAIWKDNDRSRNGFSPIPQPIKAIPQVAPRR